MADLILMNLAGSGKPGMLDNDKTLAEQGIENETVLALDLRSGAQYFLKVRISADETVELQYNFNDTIEKLKTKLSEMIQAQGEQFDLCFRGRSLEDDFKIYQYGICIGNTLNLE